MGKVNNPADTSNLVPYTGGTADITIAQDIEIDSDSKKLILGDGQDAEIYFDGSNLKIVNTGLARTDVTNSLNMDTGRFTQTARITMISGDTTPSVQVGNLFICTGGRSAGTTITDFDNGLAGQIISICADDATLTIANNVNIQLQGSANYTMADGDTITLCYGISSTATKWSELSRMTV